MWPRYIIWERCQWVSSKEIPRPFSVRCIIPFWKLLWKCIPPRPYVQTYRLYICKAFDRDAAQGSAKYRLGWEKSRLWELQKASFRFVNNGHEHQHKLINHLIQRGMCACICTRQILIEQLKQNPEIGGYCRTGTIYLWHTSMQTLYSSHWIEKDIYITHFIVISNAFEYKYNFLSISPRFLDIKNE